MVLGDIGAKCSRLDVKRNQFGLLKEVYTISFYMYTTFIYTNLISLCSRHAAASWSHIELLRFLLDNGGDVNIVDNEGDTPMHMCEQYVHTPFKRIDYR